MIMVLVQTCSKCLKQNLEAKKEISHFTITGEDKDLNLGLQETPAKVTVRIRNDSSVGGRGCAVRSAQTLLVILIPWKGLGCQVCRLTSLTEGTATFQPAPESPRKQRAALEAETQHAILTN